jgi:hypothetical protein
MPRVQYIESSVDKYFFHVYYPVKKETLCPDLNTL